MAVKPDKSQPEESEDVQAEGMDGGTGAAVRHSGSSSHMEYTSRSGRVGSELKNWADLMNSLSPKGCSGEHRHEDSLPEMTKADDDAFIDDLPLGSEANTISPGPVTSYNSTPARPQDPRLASLKATGNVGWTSFNSELSNQTSGSSATELDILLSQRGVDPEQMLRSLGFGYVSEEEPGMLRVPARFMQKSHANGINIEEFLEEYPELQRMLKKSTVAGQCNSDSSTGYDMEDLLNEIETRVPSYFPRKFIMLCDDPTLVGIVDENANEEKSNMTTSHTDVTLTLNDFEDVEGDQKTPQNGPMSPLFRDSALDDLKASQDEELNPSKDYLEPSTKSESDSVSLSSGSTVSSMSQDPYKIFNVVLSPNESLV